MAMGRDSGGLDKSQSLMTFLQSNACSMHGSMTAILLGCQLHGGADASFQLGSRVTRSPQTYDGSSDSAEVSLLSCCRLAARKISLKLDTEEIYENRRCMAIRVAVMHSQLSTQDFMI